MKNKLMNIGSSLSKKMGKMEIVAKKKSPEILLAVGFVGFAGTVVTACRATLRAKDIIEFHKEQMDMIEEAKEIVEKNPEGELEYTEELYKQDIVIQHVKTACSLAKVYAVPVALGGLSLACILASRNILNSRYLAAVAAYNSVTAVFEQYRERVRKEYGEETDKHLRYGTEFKVITNKSVDENGNKVKTSVTTQDTKVEDMVPNDDTCRFFDSTNPNWDKNPQFSMMFLRGQQNILNDILHTRGHVFLNEVYDALGFEHTPQGAILGWVEGEGDDCIDFGLYNPDKENVRRFVNGTENNILLEFNHDGVIFDKI